MSETTFENAKVGDRVWSSVYGWGEISKIYNDTIAVNIYGVPVIHFNMDGKRQIYELQTLFWDEIKIVPPERPKRKVVKKVERWAVVYKGRELINTFLKELDASTDAALTGGRVVHLTGTYEVEE